ncbi:hypothetical protein IE4872_CH00248 [Rhizobium gallicum]|uniref:Uncharacterized protein n=1 Tax=Rhizobium gallicum TaxID=56730 RepID=A0A1L5NDJ8_9HYPH|nr:hypothetical protein IE4872_CH00248 [Rhizobium gallicum]
MQGVKRCRYTAGGKACCSTGKAWAFRSAVFVTARSKLFHGSGRAFVLRRFPLQSRRRQAGPARKSREAL